MESHSVNSVDPFKNKTKSWTLKENVKLKKRKRKDRRKPSQELRAGVLSVTVSILYLQLIGFLLPHVLRASAEIGVPSVRDPWVERPCYDRCERPWDTASLPMRLHIHRRHRVSLLCGCRRLTGRCFLWWPRSLLPARPPAPRNRRFSTVCHQRAGLSLSIRKVGASTGVGQKWKQPV